MTTPSESSTSMNREAWLTGLARMLEPLFKDFKLPRYRVTCGWPCRNATGRRRRVGECHAPERSKDGTHEIFISPLLGEVPDVAGTVAHELVHVAAGIPAGHGRRFVKVARHIGLTEGRPTSAGPGPVLLGRLEVMAARLGPYPHGAITLVARVARTRPPSRATLACPRCGCKVQIGLKYLTASGPPVCGCGGLFRIPDDDRLTTDEDTGD
jgi:hypothetical protein